MVLCRDTFLGYVYLFLFGFIHLWNWTAYPECLYMSLFHSFCVDHKNLKSSDSGLPSTPSGTFLLIMSWIFASVPHFLASGTSMIFTLDLYFVSSIFVIFLNHFSLLFPFFFFFLVISDIIDSAFCSIMLLFTANYVNINSAVALLVPLKSFIYLTHHVRFYSFIFLKSHRFLLDNFLPFTVQSFYPLNVFIKDAKQFSRTFFGCFST